MLPFYIIGLTTLALIIALGAYTESWFEAICDRLERIEDIWDRLDRIAEANNEGDAG